MKLYSPKAALSVLLDAVRPDPILILSTGLWGLASLTASFMPLGELAYLIVLPFILTGLMIRAQGKEVALRLDRQFLSHARRMAIIILLLVILFGTILGTALVALSFMFSALAMIGMSREGLESMPDGLTNAFVFFGPAEWAIAAVLSGGFAWLAVWLVARTSMAIPASFALGQIKVLSVWPLTWHRVSEVISALVLVTGSGVLIQLVLVWLRIQTSGLVSVLINLLAALIFVWLILAPLMRLLQELYGRYSVENADRLEPVKTP